MKLRLNPEKLEEEGIIMLDLHGEDVMRAAEFFRNGEGVCYRMASHYYEILVEAINEALKHRRER